MSRKKPLPTMTQLLHFTFTQVILLLSIQMIQQTAHPTPFSSSPSKRFLHFIQQTDTPNWGIQLPMQIRLLNTIALMKQKKNLTFWKLKLIPAGLVDISYALKMVKILPLLSHMGYLLSKTIYCHT